MSVLDHELIAERYFFPRPDAPADVISVDVGDAVLGCHRHRLDGNGKALVHFHGNGETVADYVPWFPEILARLGYETLLAEYRGYGASSGLPLLGRMLDDTESVFHAVGRPEEDVVVFGRSVGSMYALEMAQRHPGLAGLVIESGIADPLERLRVRVRPEELGVTDEELEAAAADRLDHRRKLEGFSGRMLVMHAADDSLLHVSHGKRLAEWGPEGRTELVVFPSGDHNGIMTVNMTAYWNRVRDFLEGCSQR